MKTIFKFHDGSSDGRVNGNRLRKRKQPGSDDSSGRGSASRGHLHWNLGSSSAMNRYPRLM